MDSAARQAKRFLCRLKLDDLTPILLSMAPAGDQRRVLLGNGNPKYARIGLLRAAYRDGNAIWCSQATTSDDRAVYRYAAIPPGKYWVSARPWDSRSTGPLRPSLPCIRIASPDNRRWGADGIQRRPESGEMVEEFVQRVYYPGTPEKAAEASWSAGSRCRD
jgi:hypothetical protein